MKISNFAGMVPAINKKLRPKHFAERAVNCDFRGGRLKPFNGLKLVKDLNQSGSLDTIYKMGDAWLAWDSAVNVVKSSLSGADERIYYTGDGYPKLTDYSMAKTGGGDQYPYLSHKLGVTAPAAALSITATKINEGEDFGDVLEEVAYIYTYIAEVEAGEDYTIESGVSPTTITYEVRENEQITLQNFVLSVEEGVNVIAYRIYRLNIGDSSGAYQNVPTGRDVDGKLEYDLAVANTQFIDKDDSLDKIWQNLNVTAPTMDWIAPPDDLQGLTHYQNGLLAGFKGQEVFVSDFWSPGAYPLGHRNSTQFDIVAMSYFNSLLFITTKAGPYYLTGNDPEYLQLVPLAGNQACVSATGQVITDDSVIYPSKDGLVMFDGTQAKPFTKDILLKAQWAAYNPDTHVSFYHDGDLYIFQKGTAKGLIFRYREEKSIIEIDLGLQLVHGGYVDAEDDKLYLLISDAGNYGVYEWEGDADNKMPFTWTGYLHMRKDFAFSCARIDGDYEDGATVSLDIKVNGNAMDTKTLNNDGAFYLPHGLKGDDHEFTLSGTGEVDFLFLANSFEDLYKYGD